uniref:Uncharacterized protein n=1 Tax=Rhizophora mucronata TaxID=61149 RepID=A0A2P2K347_RHIMU
MQSLYGQSDLHVSISQTALSLWLQMSMNSFLL